MKLPTDDLDLTRARTIAQHLPETPTLPFRLRVPWEPRPTSSTHHRKAASR